MGNRDIKRYTEEIDEIPQIMTGVDDAEEEIEEGGIRKTFRVMGYVLCAIMLLVGVAAWLYLYKLNMLPMSYLAIGGVAYLIVTLLIFMCQRWLILGILTKLVSVVVCGVMVLACSYIHFTHNQVQEMTGVVTKIDNVHVYVLVDSSMENVIDAEEETFGILGIQDRENTDIVLADIEAELGAMPEVVEYQGVPELMQALYDGEVGAIVLNSAYIGIVSDDEKYAVFPDKVKSIAYKDIEREVVVEVDPENPPAEYLYDGDRVFTVYVSGVDTYGSPNVTSRSDVNILMTVNLDTRQILLISTPRDYYVPLSISNGMEDKLTHAGIYGVEVSKDTLAMLYGVQVDDYVRVNFTGFINIIDELGGITVYSDYSFSSVGYYYQEGYNDLDGQSALIFARTRKAFLSGDRQRGTNQMIVIEAVINKMATSNMLYNYRDIMDTMSDCMVTSMSYEEISDLVRFQLNDMRGWDVVSYSVNGFDSSNTTYSMYPLYSYVMIPDQETVDQAKEYLRQIYAGEKIVIQDK